MSTPLFIDQEEYANFLEHGFNNPVGSSVPTATKPPAADFTLSNYGDIANMLNTLQMQHNQSRIPGAADLEAQSSSDIASLLDPASYFADTDRRAAELGAGRGISTSAAAYSGGLRMTDEERLKRIAMGHEQLTAAYARNPTAALPDVGLFGLTPAQAEQAKLAQDELAFKYWQANRTGYGGGGRGSGGTSYSGATPNFDYLAGTQDTYGTRDSVSPFEGVWGGESYTGNDPAGAPTSFDDLYGQMFSDSSPLYDTGGGSPAYGE